MDQQQQSLRVGAAAVACAVVLRLLGGGALEPVKNWLLKPETQSFLIYLETGRILRLSGESPENTLHFGESPPPVVPVSGEIQLPVFTAEDGQAVEIYNTCRYDPDPAALITQPLSWDLTGSEPTVLIIHTHTTESYTKSPGENYSESSAYRTLDEDYNMISVGDRLASALTAGGITVIHDRELHDYPSYNGSYSDSRAAIQSYLEQYPSIQLVLDLHRDASGDLNHQFRPTAVVDGEVSAQLMLVLGTGANGRSHPNWQENLAIGLKLHTQLERIAPGITRPLCLRGERFNQDLLPGTLLIEVGAAGNSHGEALLAADVLAEGILALARGAVIDN